MGHRLVPRIRRASEECRSPLRYLICAFSSSPSILPRSAGRPRNEIRERIPTMESATLRQGKPPCLHHIAQRQTSFPQPAPQRPLHPSAEDGRQLVAVEIGVLYGGRFWESWRKTGALGSQAGGD